MTAVAPSSKTRVWSCTACARATTDPSMQLGSRQTGAPRVVHHVALGSKSCGDKVLQFMPEWTDMQ
eukprot:6877833-Alexandrium_andersonii.AAC.1